jgi:mono/diheme cytochrome c family protein
MRKAALLVALAIAVVGFCGYAAAQEQASSTDGASAVNTHPSPLAANAANTPGTNSDSGAKKTSPVVNSADAAKRIEGEKRFRANCGRCHMAPHKFPPRTMATIVRHMRVRAMITDEDMRLILRYMTQ